LQAGAVEVFDAGASGKPSASEIDIKSLHAKIGELILENNFLEGALDKAGLLSAKRRSTVLTMCR
jgi:transposase